MHAEVAATRNALPQLWVYVCTPTAVSYKYEYAINVEINIFISGKRQTAYNKTKRCERIELYVGETP